MNDSLASTTHEPAAFGSGSNSILTASTCAPATAEIQQTAETHIEIAAFSSIVVAQPFVAASVNPPTYMFIEKLKDLATLKAKAAAFEAEIQAERNSALKKLPSEMGFDSLAAFISALTDASGATKGTRRKATAPAKPAASGAKRGKRATITPEMREKAKELVADGKTGSEIAKALGISLPSVQNIKKALGLVKKRK